MTIDQRMTLKMLYQEMLKRLADDFVDEPDPKGLRPSSAEQAKIKGKPTDTIKVLEQRLEEWVHRLGVELVIVDEVQRLNSCIGELKLPLYAIEKLCLPGLLELEDEPAFTAVTSRTSVRVGSLKRLIERLIVGRSGGPEPSGLISLAAASKRIGGRPKPWAAIFQALLGGDLSYWLTGDVPTTITIRVRPEDLAVFDGVADAPSLRGPEPSPFVNQADAAEILNLKSEQVAAWCEDLSVPFVMSGRALVAPLSRVADVARETA